jgi:hypothetical protein
LFFIFSVCLSAQATAFGMRFTSTAWKAWFKAAAQTIIDELDDENNDSNGSEVRAFSGGCFFCVCFCGCFCWRRNAFVRFHTVPDSGWLADRQSDSGGADKAATASASAAADSDDVDYACFKGGGNSTLEPHQCSKAQASCCPRWF